VLFNKGKKMALVLKKLISESKLKALPSDQMPVQFFQIIKEFFQEKHLSVHLLEKYFTEYRWFSSSKFNLNQLTGAIDEKNKNVVLHSGMFNALILGQLQPQDLESVFCIFLLKTLQQAPQKEISDFCASLIGQFSAEHIEKFYDLEKEYLRIHEKDFNEKPRNVFVGQSVGFNHTDSKYQCDEEVYPDLVPVSVDFVADFKKALPKESVRVLEKISWKIFRHRMSEDVSIVDHGMCVGDDAEIYLPEDFLQYLNFHHSFDKTQKKYFHRLYLLRVLSRYPDKGIAATARALYEDLEAATKLNLEQQIEIFKNAEIKQRSNEKKLNIKGITFNVKTGELRENMNKIMEAVTLAKVERNHLAIFPELITTAYQVEDKITATEFLEKHYGHVRTINRHLRFMFAKELQASLSSEDGLLKDLNLKARQTVTREVLKKLYIHDYQYVFSSALEKPDAVDAYKEWFQKQGVFLTGEELKTVRMKENLDVFRADQNLPAEQKREMLSNALSEALKDQKVKTTSLSHILSQFAATYEDKGIAAIVPAAIPGNNPKPYNGSYYFRADGEIIIMGKKHLADEQGTYFKEKHFFEEWNQNAKQVFICRGHVLGLNICEDIWQESKIHTVRQLTHATIGDSRYIADPRLRKAYALGEILNIGAKLVVNNSASPERHPEELVHHLGEVDWENLDKHFLISEKIHGLSWKNDRNATRISLLSQVAEGNGVPIFYINSLGGYDPIFMGGCRIIMGSKGNLISSHLTNQQGAIQFSIEPGKGLHVPERFKGNHTLEPLEEVGQAIINCIRDYAVKNSKRGLMFNFDGWNLTQRYLTSLIPEIRDRDNLILEKKVKAGLEARIAEKNMKPPATEEEKEKMILKEMSKRETNYYLTYYGAPSIRKLFLEPFQFLGAFLKYRTHVYANAVLFPVGLLLYAYPHVYNLFLNNKLLLNENGDFADPRIENIDSWLTSIFSGFGYLVSWDFIAKLWIFLTFYKILNFSMKKLRIIKSNYKLPSQEAKAHFVPLGENVRAPIDPDFAPELKKDLMSYELWKDSRSVMQGMMGHIISFSESLQGLYYNNLSRLRAFFDFNIKDSLNVDTISLGYLNRNEKLKGYFPNGGHEIGDYNVTHTVSAYTIQGLYLMQIKKELAGSVYFKKWKEFHLTSKLRRISGYVETRNALLNYFNCWFKPWGINKLAQKYYKRRIWKDVLDLNKQMIEQRLSRIRELRKGTNGVKSLKILEKQLKQLRIRKREINQKISVLTKDIGRAVAKGKKPGLKKNAIASHQSFHLPGFFSSTEWIYRDTRTHHTNVVDLGERAVSGSDCFD
jgi:predicted amidohydrolase